MPAPLMRLAWLVAIWAASVLSLGVVAFFIRLALHAAS